MSPQSLKKNIDQFKETFVKSGLSSDITDEEFDLLFELSQEQSFEKDKYILHEKDDSRDLYLIYEGNVSVRIKMPTMHYQEEVIARLKDNDVFGEFAFVRGKPRSATIKAESDVVLFRFDFDSLQRLFDANPRIGLKVMKNIAVIISDKVIKSQEQMRKLMFQW